MPITMTFEQTTSFCCKFNVDHPRYIHSMDLEKLKRVISNLVFPAWNDVAPPFFFSFYAELGFSLACFRIEDCIAPQFFTQTWVMHHNCVFDEL